jgi:hypothetical protein
MKSFISPTLIVAFAVLHPSEISARDYKIKFIIPSRDFIIPSRDL